MGSSCVRAVEPGYDELPMRLRMQEAMSGGREDAEETTELPVAHILRNGHAQSHFEAKLESWALQEPCIQPCILPRPCSLNDAPLAPASCRNLTSCGTSMPANAADSVSTMDSSELDDVLQRAPPPRPPHRTAQPRSLQAQPRPERQQKLEAEGKEVSGIASRSLCCCRNDGNIRMETVAVIIQEVVTTR